MALAGGGSFTAETISLHTKTNAAVISIFLPVAVEYSSAEKTLHFVTVRS
jgi:RNA 3'-terminal phosphate cyclase (ATP)